MIFHTITDVAERWGCHPRFVYDLVHAGDLTAIKIAGKWRIRPEDVEAWEAAHQNRPVVVRRRGRPRKRHRQAS